MPLTGCSFADDWAANHVGSMALNISTNAGLLALNTSSGTQIWSESAIHINSTFAKLNAILGTLTLTVSRPGTATVGLDIWNQAGERSKTTVTVTVS